MCMIMAVGLPCAMRCPPTCLSHIPSSQRNMPAKGAKKAAKPKAVKKATKAPKKGKSTKPKKAGGKGKKAAAKA